MDHSGPGYPGSTGRSWDACIEARMAKEEDWEALSAL